MGPFSRGVSSDSKSLLADSSGPTSFNNNNVVDEDIDAKQGWRGNGVF